ncbi:SDR family oxidoreductase [Candidatus Saccharibacteria bacterium]|nr:MAG: SDR family oxidoreductase [Candidatus Saccharibacteria bacterium]
MKNILITGAAQGIGRVIAKTLQKEANAKLYIIDKQETDFIRQNTSDNFVFFLQDLADRRGLEQVLSELLAVEFDAIVNDAGEVYLEKWDELKMQTWDRTLAVNVTAPLQIVHALRDSLNSGSSIVNIASVDGMMAAYDTVAYAASKAALINLTKSLAANLGSRNIRVNAIAPGWVETEMTKDTLPDESTYMTPLGRNASAQNIANVVEFLISEKSSFISGEVITVDGGLTTVDYTLKAESGL